MHFFSIFLAISFTPFSVFAILCNILDINLLKVDKKFFFAFRNFILLKCKILSSAFHIDLQFIMVVGPDQNHYILQIRFYLNIV